jgi:purine-binding chemotaxis protein CheW
MKQTLTQESAALSVFLESLFRDMPQEEEAAAPAKAPESAPATAPEPPPATVPPSGVDRVLGEGESEFKALLMDLGGMQVAAALTQLGSVIPWPEGLTEVPGRAPWMLGVCRHRGRNVRVVDLRRLLSPPGRGAEEAPPGRIVIAHERDWGLACAAVSEVVTLGRDGVQWRTNRRHPWLLGTVVGRMSVLLDVAQFVQWLEDGAPGR